MRKEDAEALVARLRSRVSDRQGYDRDAFDLRDIWIEGADGNYQVKMIYRQDPRCGWWGYTVRDVLPSYQDRKITPEEAADDIYDFVLVEPDHPPTSDPDANGVRWRTQTVR